VVNVRQIDRKTFWWSAVQAIPSVLVVGILTFICFEIHLGLSSVSLLYLLIVVIQSLSGNFQSSVIVSVFAVLCLDYFFTDPLFSLRVSDSSEAVALIVFLVAGLVITRLTTRAQQAAHLEKIQREDTSRLYEVSQQLMAMEPGTSVYEPLLQCYKSKFDLISVCAFDGVTAKTYVSGESRFQTAERTRDSFISRNEATDAGSGIAIRLLKASSGIIGAIGFEGLRETQLTPRSLAALTALAIERSAAFHNASHAAAVAEAESFRGAVLDALAHEFKTPLATIIMATSALRDADSLDAAQKEMLFLAESEAAHLEQLTCRLLRLARLDREDVKPHFEPLELNSLIWSVVDQYSRRWPDRFFEFAGIPRCVMSGDQELLRLAIGQLIDNACKYSRTGSKIRISCDINEAKIDACVWNSGDAIPASERARVFDRFYRGTDVRNSTAGSGLGLYVARKIAIAHQGDITLENSVNDNMGTTFHICLPLLEEGEN
jgi:two-component system, OmpR family, sensor histidine kinase KdpD